MTETVNASQPADGRRHKVTCDVHLILRDAGRVLFGRRENTGYGDGAYHLPAGHLEVGESAVQALIREAREEIGVSIKPENVGFVHVMHNSSSGGRVAIFFEVTTWDGEPENREPEKCAELRWFSLSELPDKMLGYCRSALDDIAEGNPFSVYGW